MTKGKILKEIRLFCLDCMGGSSNEVDNCTAPNCKMYQFRYGKDPSPSKRGFGSRLHVKKKVLTKTSEVGGA